MMVIWGFELWRKVVLTKCFGPRIDPGCSVPRLSAGIARLLPPMRRRTLGASCLRAATIPYICFIDSLDLSICELLLRSTLSYPTPSLISSSYWSSFRYLFCYSGPGVDAAAKQQLDFLEGTVAALHNQQQFMWVTALWETTFWLPTIRYVSICLLWDVVGD